MYIVSWTDFDGVSYVARYELCESRAEALAKGKDLSQIDGVYCWGVSEVIDASEPHWIDSPHHSQQGTDR